MRYRTLGRTGLEVSVLGYGASALGGVFGEIDEAEGVRSVHTALDLGVNYIDVSPYYGLMRAEAVLGNALRGIQRDRYFISTKVGRYGDRKFDFSPERITRSIDESLDRLGLDHVDVLFCHDIEFVNLNQIVEEAIPTLRALQQQGKTRFIGISGYPLKIFRYVLFRTDVDAVISYCHYALNDTSLEKLLSMLVDRNVGIINASPLSMGLLTHDGPPQWHPASTSLREACARAAEHCRREGSDIADLALQFAIARPEIATTLVGMPDRDKVRRNCAAISALPDEQLLNAICRILQPVKDQEWASGLPENNY
jgi:L-galactose dehydrogenase